MDDEGKNQVLPLHTYLPIVDDQFYHDGETTVLLNGRGSQYVATKRSMMKVRDESLFFCSSHGTERDKSQWENERIGRIALSEMDGDGITQKGRYTAFPWDQGILPSVERIIFFLLLLGLLGNI